MVTVAEILYVSTQSSLDTVVTMYGTVDPVVAMLIESVSEILLRSGNIAVFQCLDDLTPKQPDRNRPMPFEIRTQEETPLPFLSAFFFKIISHQR